MNKMSAFLLFIGAAFAVSSSAQIEELSKEPAGRCTFSGIGETISNEISEAQGFGFNVQKDDLYDAYVNVKLKNNKLSGMIQVIENGVGPVMTNYFKEVGNTLEFNLNKKDRDLIKLNCILYKTVN